MEPIITAKDILIRFRLANDKVDTLKEYFVAVVKRKLKYGEFWALQDVSFERKRGDVLGVIGNNGAGKSTLLKVISGIMKPTCGDIVVNGNVAPMLELGSGFDHNLSSGENIFLNGAILGYSEEFLKEKYDELVEFSELGEFINQPLRNYSSGMIMRLAFSIATLVNPDILIVDEILSVGDAGFRAKSERRMKELMGGGTTVLFVSHALPQIRQMCNKVLWLDHGKVVAFGPTKEICDRYVKGK